MSDGDLTAFYTGAYGGRPAAEAERLGRWRALGARTKADHAEVLLARAALRPDALIEIGCGDGALLDELRRRALARRIAGAELSPTAAGLARDRGHAVEVFDGTHVPAADDAYDLAVLSHVVEHVPEPVPLLREAARVARHVLLEVPLEDNRSARRPAKRAEAERIGHVHAFSRRDVAGLLASAGLTPVDALTDALPLEHHAFFAADRRAAALKWAVRTAVWRLAPALAERAFTVHYAVLARSG